VIETTSLRISRLWACSTPISEHALSWLLTIRVYYCIILKMTRSFDQLLSPLVQYDLADYSNGAVDDAGELEVLGQFINPLYLKLGHDVLELTRLSIDLGADLGEKDDRATGYVLQNLSAGTSEAPILFGNDSQEVGEIGDGRNALRGGRLLTLGRAADATPALRLSNSTSRRHAELRVGSINRNLHFLDLYSKNGTSIYLSPEDAGRLSPPRRTLHLIGKIDAKYATEVEQRWFRRSDAE
jgi:hypothetical protein